MIDLRFGEKGNVLGARYGLASALIGYSIRRTREYEKPVPLFFSQLVQGLGCMIVNWAIRSSLTVEGFGSEIAASPFKFRPIPGSPAEP
jgi:hypothetical protein